MTGKQKAGLILAAAGACALLYTALSISWFQNRIGMGEFQIGLLSWKQCFLEECTEKSLDAFKDDAGTFVLAARITFALGLLSVAMLVVVGVLGYLRHRLVHGLGKLTLLALIATIMAALVVMIYKPTLANASNGVFLFMIGGMAGVIGAHLLSTPETYEDGAQEPPGPEL